jgi:hypothetical protein
MTRSSRSIALAAVLLTVSLAAPAAANAARTSDRSDGGGVEVVATDSGRGWLEAMFGAAWTWLSALVDEDNGSIMP